MYRIVILVFLALLHTVLSKFNVTDQASRLRRQSENKCILPPYPTNGRYSVGGSEDVGPGQSLVAAQVLVTCEPGYQSVGAATLFCVNGVWSSSFPVCVLACRLDPHPSVKYRCSDEYAEDFRECRDHEPSGTIVRPQCNSPNYYYSGALSYMRCIEGRWNYVAICQPECGRVADGKPLILDGRVTLRGEFPWHAGIYLKTSEPYRLICGGSIVSTSIIISAAHCFWHQGRVRPASEVAVAVGKFYRGWDNPHDDEAQKFDITNIKIPARYQDARTNYQDDVAILTLSAPIVYRPYVRPVCVDFDEIFNRHQLKENSLGRVAGWGLVDTEGTASPVLKVLEVPYVRVERCIDEAPASFRPFITSDKICAGYTNGSTLCRGDSGGGLVFSALNYGTERYYLRGIVSTAPESDDACNAFARTTFTHIIQHKGFIEENTLLFETPVILQQETAILCVLPSYPTHGRYDVAGTSGGSPGQKFYTAQIQVKCNEDYTLQGNASLSCSYGRWSSSLPRCVRNTIKKSEVIKTASFKLDLNGLGCGQIQANGSHFPWAAAIYTSAPRGRYHRCGGMVISRTVVLTASHCAQELEKTTIEVAVGNQYPSWNHRRDINRTQTSKVAFRRYADNILALKLATPLQFNEAVQPACVDFDEETEKEQYERGTGLMASWNFEAAHLTTYEVTHQKIEQCVKADSMGVDTPNIECFTAKSGPGVCRGDGGFGVVFPSNTTSGLRYILRSVVPFSLVSGDCSSWTFKAIQIQKYQSFLAPLLVNTEETVSST